MSSLYASNSNPPNSMKYTSLVEEAEGNKKKQVPIICEGFYRKLVLPVCT